MVQLAVFLVKSSARKSPKRPEHPAFWREAGPAGSVFLEFVEARKQKKTRLFQVDTHKKTEVFLLRSQKLGFAGRFGKMLKS